MEERLSSNRINLFTKLIITIMMGIMMVYPMSIAIGKLFSGWNNYWDQKGSLLVLLISLFVFTGIGAIVRMIPQHIIGKKRLALYIGVFCVSFVPRIFVAYTMQSTPANDFQNCFYYALGSGSYSVDVLACVPYQGAYALALKTFFRIIGYGSLPAAQVMNSLVTSFIPVMLFALVYQLTNNCKPAILASLLYACFPTMIIYNTICSPEHFSQFFFVAFALIYVKYRKIPYNNAKKYVVALALSIVGGLACLFKELFVIIAPVFFMTTLCFEIIPACMHRDDNHSRIKKAAIILIVCIVIIALVFASYTSFVSIVKYVLMGEVIDSVSPMSVPVMYNIYRGLSRISRGIWNEEVNTMAESIMQNSSSRSEINTAFINQLITEYNSDLSELWKTLDYKIGIDWCDEGLYFYWSSRGDNALYADTVAGNLMFSLLPAFYSMCIYILAIIACITAIIRTWINKFQQVEFFMYGFIFIFVILLSLMECAGRYKSNVTPYLCAMVGIGIYGVVDIFKLGLQKIRQNYAQKHALT